MRSPFEKLNFEDNGLLCFCGGLTRSNLIRNFLPKYNSVGDWPVANVGVDDRHLNSIRLNLSSFVPCSSAIDSIRDFKVRIAFYA